MKPLKLFLNKLLARCRKRASRILLTIADEEIRITAQETRLRVPDVPPSDWNREIGSHPRNDKVSMDPKNLAARALQIHEEVCSTRAVSSGEKADD